jgi:D-alanine-D-alanine ligase-like ATP-grasp enzyme
MQNEPIEVTLRVTAVLEKLGIPYVIGGSLASTLHGMITNHPGLRHHHRNAP